jgi:S-adenosylmethionine decarboxylase
MTGGTEWLIDAFDCAPARLGSRADINALLADAIAQLHLSVVTQAEHQFPDPPGITAMVLLAESHLTIHTFPESGVATLNLYCCAPSALHHNFDWSACCARHLGAGAVKITVADRGGQATQAHVPANVSVAS